MSNELKLEAERKGRREGIFTAYEWDWGQALTFGSILAATDPVGERLFIQTGGCFWSAVIRRFSLRSLLLLIATFELVTSCEEFMIGMINIVASD